MTKPANFPGRKQERRIRALRRLDAQTSPSKLTPSQRRALLDTLTIRVGENGGARAIHTKKSRIGFARFARA